MITGDYETNQRDDLIPGWYTRAQFRCATTANWYFAVDSLEFWARSQQPSTDELQTAGYRQWGVVTVQGAPRMTIYSRGPAVDTGPQTLALESYAPGFDVNATADLPLGYPVVEPPIPNPIHANLDDQVWLEGYELTYAEPLRPGDTITLTLYWRGATGRVITVQGFQPGLLWRRHYGRAAGWHTSLQPAAHDGLAARRVDRGHLPHPHC